MVTNDPDTQDATRVRALSEDHALPVLAVHAPFLLMSRRVWGRDPLGKIDRAIELALGVGAPLVVVHPPYRWQSAYRRWLDEALPSVATERGVRVAVENMFPLRVRGRSVARFHAHQSLEDLDGFPNVTLDTSHLAVSGLDPVEAVTRLGDRLAHVHLSNNAGKGWDSHLPLDEGCPRPRSVPRGARGTRVPRGDLARDRPAQPPRRRPGLAPHPVPQPRALRGRAHAPRLIRCVRGWSNRFALGTTASLPRCAASRSSRSSCCSGC